MKWLNILILVFILTSCFSKQIKVNIKDDYVQKIHIDTVANTYGGSYSIETCETEIGYCVKFVNQKNISNYDLTNYNVILRTQEFFIYLIEKIETEKIVYEYYYNNYENDYLLYSCEQLPYEENYLKIFINNNSEKAYFYYLLNENIIINEVLNGKLVEIERINYYEDEYAFDSIVAYKDTYYKKYLSKENIKYIIDDKDYVFKKLDKVIFLDDYLFVNEYEIGNSNPVNSYCVEIDTGIVKDYDKAIKLKNTIIHKNQFIYVDNKTYHLANLTENELEIFDLQIEYIEDKLFGYGFMNDHDIIFMIINGSDIDVELVRLKISK